jgi:hypothetical protein
MAERGYVLDWLWHGKAEVGPVNLDSKWITQKGFDRTQLVVLTLVNRLPKKGRGFSIWMDNLFTSYKLLTELRSIGIGGAGTIRTLKTEEEEKEVRNSI